MGSSFSTKDNKSKRSSDANQNPTQSDKHEVSTQTISESTGMETTEGTKYATIANEPNVGDEHTYQSGRISEAPRDASVQASTNAEDRINTSGNNHSKRESSKTVTTEFQVPRQARDFLGQQGKNGKKKPQKSEKQKRHDDVSHPTNTDENHATTLANYRDKLQESERKVESLESEVITLRKEKNEWMNRRNGDEGKEDVGLSVKNATDTRISATHSTSRQECRAELVNRQAQECLEEQGENGERKSQKSEKMKRHDDVSYTTNTDENHATTLANYRDKLHENERKVESLESEVITMRKEKDAWMNRPNGDEGKEDVGFSAKDATDTLISATHSTSRQDGRAELVNRQAQECLDEQGENGERKSQKSEKTKRHDGVSNATNTDENHATNLTNDKEKLHEYERKVERLKSEVIKLRNEKDAWMNRQAPEGLEQQHEDGAKNPHETKEEKKRDDDSYSTNTDENYTTDLEIDRKKMQEYERKVESLESDVKNLKMERDTLQNRLTLEGLEEQTDDGKKKPQKTKEEKRHDYISYATNTDENHAKDLTNDRKNSYEYERKVESLEADVVKLRKEKDALLNRLSEIGAIKLTKRNHKVTDLSDENRPEILVEQFSEIYDNEWTDAYENLTKRQCQQTDLSEKLLLDVLKETYTICLSSTKEKRNALRVAIYNYIGLSKDATDLDLKKTEQRIRDHRKKTLEKNISKLDREVRDQLKSKLEKEIYECLSDYIGKCITICWNMCTKETPMYLDFGDWKQTAQSGDEKPANMPFDKLKFVTYTKSGDYIDYVVWPAVYLYENGPLMRKGVAQGFK